MDEPILIKASDGLLKLGYKNELVKVDVRLVPEDVYQEMKMQMYKQPIDRRLFKSLVSRFIKKYSEKQVPEREKLAMEYISDKLYREFNIHSKDRF